MKKVRWAICGLGKIAERFYRVANECENAEVVAAVSSDRDRAVAFKDAHGLRYACTYDGLSQIKHEVDAVYVATNMHLHCPNALEFLAAGIPCLVEKSFALNDTEAKAMIDAARKHNTLLMEAMWTVFLPASLQVKLLIESGNFGRPLSATGRFCCDMTGNSKSRVFDKSVGGGSILDLMVYNVAFAQMLFGAPESVETACRMKNGIDLSCDAAVSFGGVPVSLRSSIDAKTPEEHFTVLLEDGRIDIPQFFGATTFTVTQGEKKTAYNFETRDGFYYQIDHFNRLVLDGEKESPVRTLADTLTTMEVLTKLQCGGTE